MKRVRTNIGGVELQSHTRERIQTESNHLNCSLCFVREKSKQVKIKDYISLNSISKCFSKQDSALDEGGFI